MIIRIQTSKGNEIPNYQGTEIAVCELNMAQSLPQKYPEVKLRTESSAAYNCFGLVFASRRSKIIDYPIQNILRDDEYIEVAEERVLPGDVIVYYDDSGDSTHAGIVVEIRSELRIPIICSKWGNGPEVIHRHFDVPDIYGKIYRYYRCRL